MGWILAILIVGVTVSEPERKALLQQPNECGLAALDR